MTDSVEHDEVERLFHEALDLASSSREAFVRASARSPAAAEKAIALLRADAAPPASFLRDGVLEQAVGELFRAAPEATVPATAGPWRLGEVLFADGSGVVAAGIDAEGRERCVKVFHADPGRDAQRAIRHERALLESMDQPGVAKVLESSDAGPTPYLVLDCEPGVPLGRFCTQACVPLSGRLELLCQFSSVVARAHERGVIHGSITPDKLRCEERSGGVRFLVLGFGAPPDESVAAAVGAGCYAAPEIVSGTGASDVLVDVYSLGAVLYELLTSTAPIAPGAVVARAAAPGSPATLDRTQAPSERLAAVGRVADLHPGPDKIDDQRLARLLREKLDPVVLRALEPHPGRRHESVAAMIERLRTVLTDAWPDRDRMSVTERALRWMRSLLSPPRNS